MSPDDDDADPEADGGVSLTKPEPPGQGTSGQGTAEQTTGGTAAADPEPGTTQTADPASADAPARTGRRRRRKQRSFFAELPFLVVLAVLLAFVIKTFLVQAFYIPSGSMEQTLAINDRVLVNKLVYDTRDPKRGEIVVFDGAKSPPGQYGAGFKGIEENPVKPASNAFQAGVRKFQCFVGIGCTTDQDFIKRVIAVGGDTVQCCDSQGRVMVNGVPLDEPYVYDDNHMAIPSFVVPAGYLWVMGDHRGNSRDSRFQGPIPVDSVVGRAFVTVYPFNRFGGHGIPSTFDNRGSASAPLTPLDATPGAAGLLVALPLTGLRRRRIMRSTRHEGSTVSSGGPARHRG